MKANPDQNGCRVGAAFCMGCCPNGPNLPLGCRCLCQQFVFIAVVDNKPSCCWKSRSYCIRSQSWKLSQSNQLVVPPVKLSSYGPRSFAVAGPTTWNSLPEYLRDPELPIDSFRRQLKQTFLFAQYWRRRSSALETFVPSRSINLLFTLHYIYITLCSDAVWYRDLQYRVFNNNDMA